MELSSGWIWAYVWLSGGWIIFLRVKEPGKNLEGYCHKLMVGTWVDGGIATESVIFLPESYSSWLSWDLQGWTCEWEGLWYRWLAVGLWGLKWLKVVSTGPLWGKGGKHARHDTQTCFLLISQQTSLGGLQSTKILWDWCVSSQDTQKCFIVVICAGSGDFYVRA